MTSEDGEIIWKRDEGDEEQDDVWDDTALVKAYDKAVSRVKDEIARRINNVPSSSGKNNQKAKKKGKPKNKNVWKVGDYCQAVFSEDELLYEARIKGIDEVEGTCVVEYLGYGNIADVLLEELQPSQGRSARMQQEDEARAEMNAEISGCDDVESRSSQGSEEGILSYRKHKNKRNRHRHHQTTRQSSSKANSVPSHQHSSNQWQFPFPPTSPPVQSGHPPPFFPSQFPPGFSHIPPPPLPPPCASLSGKSNATFKIPPVPPPPVIAPEDGVMNSDEALASMLMAWYMAGYHTGYFQGYHHGKGRSDASPSHTSNIPCCNCNH